VHHSLPGEPDSLKKLSDELRELAARFRERTVTLREVMAVLGARASALLCVILALPFCAPISIPGLSLPFGLAIATIALRFTLGLPPWLPRWLLDRRLPPRFFRAVLEGAGRFVGWIERRLKPRWRWFTSTGPHRRLHSLAIFLSALLLMLPIGGIPFTNTLPALAIVIGTLGVLERDGIAIAAAHGLLAATLVYFATFAAVGFKLIEQALRWLTG
jgi:hypothetical protein